MRYKKLIKGFREYIKNKKIKTSTNGITLISLVITIIILILLAGVGITLAIQENGIIKTAKKAVNKTNEAQALEELEQKIIDVQLEKAGNAILMEVLIKLSEDEEYIILGEDENSITKKNIEELDENIQQVYVAHKNYKFKIDNKLIVTFITKIDTTVEKELTEFQEILKKCDLKTTYTKQDVIDNKDGILNVMLNKQIGFEYILNDSEIYKNIDLDYILNIDFLNSIDANSKGIIKSNQYVVGNIRNKENLNEIIDCLNFTSIVPNLSSNSNCIYSSMYTACNPYQAFDTSDNTYWCSAAYKQNDAYIGYNFRTKKRVLLASLKNGNLKYGTNERCKEIVLQCRNEDNNWIDASEVVTLQDNSNKTYIFNTKVTEEYSQWRILVKSSYGIYSSTREVKFLSI